VLRFKREVNAQTKRERAMYLAGDVERLRMERLNRVKTVTTRALATMPAPVRALLGQGEISPTPTSRPWLRIAELAAEWDVSAGAILELIRSGQLAARRFHSRDPWRIHRADAEALRGERYSEAPPLPLAKGEAAP